jgi:solute:Na+ symporter, SSS family
MLNQKIRRQDSTSALDSIQSIWKCAAAETDFMALTSIDIAIFVVYSLLVVAVGVYFYSKTSNSESYYTGGKEMKASHIGLSVVATDVGGGFSIGLGGLGFTLGLSGSWLLFTGLVGAWLSAVFLIPVVFKTPGHEKLSTFPGFLGAYFGPRVAILAGSISVLGYLGFTSAQLLAGAKLAAGTLPQINSTFILIGMGLAAVLYTALGGMKAVVYTDTIQWSVLMLGLGGIGIPLGFFAVGGWDGLAQTLPADFFSLLSLSPLQILEWSFTILPIWFVGMTLYQRIFACKDAKTAKRAWFLAGLFEYPVMAFMGVGLGILARAGAELGMMTELGFPSAAAIADPEIALPMFIVSVLPPGLTGLMLAAYFSAIMSTADSCLMAASGNLSTDILKLNSSSLKYNQLITLLLGLVAIGIAWKAEQVLQVMLSSYAVMVSGMLVPVMAILLKIRLSPLAAIVAMCCGGLAAIFFDLVFNFGPYVVPAAMTCSIFGAYSVQLFTPKNSQWQS